ncbi:MAG: alpha/beta fold hydrolase [Pseudonocardiales bacterium]|nr:alpha/beta fold hydrolase [Pseudonocardiales bacterium]
MIRLRDHCRAAAAGMILAAVLLSAAVTVPASAAEDPSPPGGLLGIQVPSLSWKDCANRDNGLQCATAQVPRDYRNLGRGSLSLNLKRHLATDSTHRIGSLFVNPGGPGGSAAGFVSAVVSRLPAEVASRFDVVGFDPRGVAASGQVTCMTQEETEQAWAGVSASVQPGAFERGQRAAEQFNAGCQTRSGDLLSYIGTEYVARDMDLLRAAVGDKKLNYFGVSFGTFIGTVYANLFPTRIRVMALDGAYDPEAYANNPYKYDYGQYVALEGALHRFLGWCADSPDCPFGHGDPVTTYDTLVSDLDNNPVRDAHGKVVANGATLTYRVMFALNGGRPGWLGIAKDLSAAQQRGGSYVDSIGSKSSFFAANVAVECADRVYPPSKLLLRYRLALSTASAPRTGSVAAYGPPGYDHSHANACQKWPAKRASRYAGPWNAHGSAPILVVGTTGDPDTPYQDAVTLATTLDNGHLLTFVGEGHSGFAHSSCSRAAEVAYLIGLTLPQDRARCTDDPPPAASVHDTATPHETLSAPPVLAATSDDLSACHYGRRSGDRGSTQWSSRRTPRRV